MKKVMTVCLLTVGAITAFSAAPDLKNPALTPVKFGKPANHKPIKLVEKGKLNFAIVYNRKNRADSASAGRAAVILQDAIEKCTGQKVAIYDVKEMDKAMKHPYRIVLGYNDITKKLGADPFKGPKQGYEIFTTGDTIAIVGYDSNLLTKAEKAKVDLTDVAPLRGTLWGACDFVERMFGCRWYFPGEYGSLYPKITDLTIPALRYSDAPHFFNRDGCWIGWSLRGNAKWEKLLGKNHPSTGTPDKNIRIQERWRLENFMGPYPFHPGHDPEPKFLTQWYPDRDKDIYFTNESGHMYRNKKAHIGNSFDLTNLKFADLIIDAMHKFYASKGKTHRIWSYSPNTRFVNFGQCDGEVKDYDMMRNPTVKKLNLITEANIKRGCIQSDVYGRFLQYYATRVKKEFPGLKVAFMPYQGGTRAPLDPRWKLPDNIVLRVCTHALPRVPLNKKKIAGTLQTLKEWYEATNNRPIDSLYFYNIPAEKNGGSELIRAICSQFVGDSIKVCGKYLGNMNIFYDQYGGLNWSHYYSEYCAARAFWNPDFNVDAAIDEHWEPFYGKEAGKELRKFHKTLKDAYIKHYMMDDNVPVTGSGINPLFPSKVVDTLEKHLLNAKKYIKPGSIEEKRYLVLSEPYARAFQAQRSRQSYVKPVYNVYQILKTEAVTVDGVGNEPFWKKVKPAILQDATGSGTKTQFPVSIKLAWKADGIYGLLEAKHKPEANPKKDIWHNDSCEIFFSPKKHRRDFYHFVFDTMNNTRTGYRNIFPIITPYNGTWKGVGFTSKAIVKDNSWTAEFFIPFKCMQEKTPAPYTLWNANIVSNKLNRPQESRSTSMTLNDNHNLGMYGSIKFLGKGDL